MTFKRTIVVDAKNHLIGRLAASIAKELLLGQRIVIVRAEEVLMHGDKAKNLAILQEAARKRMNTNPRRGPFHPHNPSVLLYRVIRGMVPYKTPRGEAAMKSLQVYEGVPARFQRVKRMLVPAALKIVRLRPGTQTVKLGVVAKEFGWSFQNVVENVEAKRKLASARYFKVKKHFKKLATKAKDKASKSDDKVKKLNAELAKLGY